MTAPTTTAAGVTNPWTLTPGAPPVRITDGTNNSPAGLTLVNRGDNGQNVWIMGGPAAQSGAVPLGPGASLQWSDPVNLPYAYVTGAGRPETLVVSSQSAGYNNPATVAGTLIAQGIPSTMLDTDYGTAVVNAGSSLVPVIVGQSATLLVSVFWSQPTPVGRNVLRVRFDDPAAPSFTPVDYFLTGDNRFETLQFTWVVPIMGPRVTVTNVRSVDNNNSPAIVSLVGNNRPTTRLRQIGGPDDTMPHSYQYPSTWLNTGNPQPIFGLGTATVQSRYNGPVIVSMQPPVAGFIYAYWVTADGSEAHTGFAVNAGLNTWNWGHPSVPVTWCYQPNTVVNNYVYGSVTANY